MNRLILIVFRLILICDCFSRVILYCWRSYKATADGTRVSSQWSMSIGVIACVSKPRDHPLRSVRSVPWDHSKMRRWRSMARSAPLRLRSNLTVSGERFSSATRPLARRASRRLCHLSGSTWHDWALLLCAPRTSGEPHMASGKWGCSLARRRCSAAIQSSGGLGFALIDDMLCFFYLLSAQSNLPYSLSISIAKLFLEGCTSKFSNDRCARLFYLDALDMRRFFYRHHHLHFRSDSSRNHLMKSKSNTGTRLQNERDKHTLMHHDSDDTCQQCNQQIRRTQPCTHLSPMHEAKNKCRNKKLDREVCRFDRIRKNVF